MTVRSDRNGDVEFLGGTDLFLGPVDLAMNDEVKNTSSMMMMQRAMYGRTRMG